MKSRSNIFPLSVEDRTLPHDKSGVQSIGTLGRLWVIGVVSAMSAVSPLYPKNRHRRLDRPRPKSAIADIALLFVLENESRTAA
jgi:hypothetical protein